MAKSVLLAFAGLFTAVMLPLKSLYNCAGGGCDQVEHKELRIVAFGTSQTQGTFLSDSKTEAYPFLLSNLTTNLAMTSSGPSYPVLCAQSMIGEEAVYDVIILEYYLHAPQGLLFLARRLRKRFPDAMIIFVKIWQPRHVTHTGTKQSFHSWVKQNIDPNVLFHSVEFNDAILATSEEDWYYMVHSDCDEAVESAAKAVNGYIYELPKDKTPRQAIIELKTWFAKDYRHLSDVGHAIVAEGLKDMIGNRGRKDKLGSWGTGDLCVSWHEDGNIDLDLEGDLHLVTLESGNYVLEGHGGRFTILNPFATDHTLYLTYIAQTAPSEYPRTIVTLKDPTTQQLLRMDVELNPTTVAPGQSAKVTKIGVVPPGYTIVELHPMERKQFDFGLMGYSLSDDLATDFALFDH